LVCLTIVTGVTMTYSEIEDPELSTLVKEQFESAHRIFYDRVQGEQLMCSIYDVFDKPGSPDHNCLGCNFDEITDQISKFLFTCASNPDLFLPQQSFAIYTMLLNVVWERITDVFEIISLPKDYRVRYFGVLIRVRKWANFFKHPKAFAWMVHHPEYTFEGTEYGKALLTDPDWLKVDDEFLKRYYASEKSKGLTKKLEGKENKVIVVLPDLEALTTSICDCLDKFIEIITRNQVYREILDEKATFVSYYSEAESGQESPPNNAMQPTA